MILFKVLLVIAFAAAGVLLALSNPGSTEVNYLVGQIEIPTAWLVVGTLAVGALIGAGIGAAAAVQWRYRARKWQRKAEEAHEALGHLRDSSPRGA